MPDKITGILNLMNKIKTSMNMLHLARKKILLQFIKIME